MGNLAERLLDSAGHDVDTGSFVVVVALEVLESLDGTDICYAASGKVTFLYSCTGGVKGVFHAVFLLLHLNLGGCTYVENRNAAGEFAETLLEFLAVVVGGGGGNLLADKLCAGVDFFLAAGSADDGGVLLGDGDLLGPAEHCYGSVLEGISAFFADDGTSGEDCDVLEHFLAAVAESGGLYCSHLEGAAEAVHDEGGKSLALDILSNNKEGFAFTGDRLENWHQLFHAGDLLVGKEDVSVVEDGFHLVAVGHEVRRNVAAVELHAVNDLDLSFGALGFLDGDYAVFLDLCHGVGDEFADIGVVIGGNGSDLLDLAEVVADFLALLLEVGDNGSDCFVDTPLEVHRICTGGDVLDTYVNDRLREDGGGGGAVAGLLVGLRGYLLDHLCAHVGEAVFEFNFLCYGYTVLGYLGCTEFLINHHIAAFGAEGYLDCVRKSVSSFLHLGADIDIEFYIFCHGYKFLKGCENVRLTDDEIFLAVDGNFSAGVFAVEDYVSDLHLHRFVFLSGACSSDYALLGLLFCGVRNIQS